MSDAPAASPAILLTLTVVTGLVDAVSYLALNHVFTANMTGNIVFLGFALAGARGLSISRPLVALIAFLLRAVAGGRMTVEFSGRHWVSRALLMEASLLAFGAGLVIISPRQPYLIIATTALAMGVRNAVVRKLGVPDLTTTALTLTITGLAADSGPAGGHNPRWQRRGAAVLAMLAGATSGAQMVHYSIWFPLAICSVITAGCAVAEMRSIQNRQTDDR